MPDIGRLPGGSGSGGASPILTISSSGKRGDGGGLGMLRPLGVGPDHAAGAFGGDDRFLQVGGVPVQHRLCHGIAVFRHAEHAQRRGAVVGEVGVDVAPAAVFGRVDAHDRIAPGGDLAVAEFHVMAAAQGCGGMADVDRDGLAAAGAQFPQVGGGKPVAARVAAPATPMRNGVGRIGSVPPANVTVLARSADIRRRAESSEGPLSAWALPPQCM